MTITKQQFAKHIRHCYQITLWSDNKFNSIYATTEHSCERLADLTGLYIHPLFQQV